MDIDDIAGKRCVFDTCGVNKRNAKFLRLFRFPPKISPMWDVWTKICDINISTVTHELFICEYHFHEKYIGKKYLKSDAIPERLLYYYDHSLQNITTNDNDINHNNSSSSPPPAVMPVTIEIPDLLKLNNENVSDPLSCDINWPKNNSRIELEHVKSTTTTSIQEHFNIKNGSSSSIDKLAINPINNPVTNHVTSCDINDLVDNNIIIKHEKSDDAISLTDEDFNIPPMLCDIMLKKRRRVDSRKSGKKCIICKVSKRMFPDRKFFVFPKKESEMYDTWVFACKLDENANTHNAVVCNEHFCTYEIGAKRLKKNVIPKFDPETARSLEEKRKIENYVEQPHNDSLDFDEDYNDGDEDNIDCQQCSAKDTQIEFYQNKYAILYDNMQKWRQKYCAKNKENRKLLQQTERYKQKIKSLKRLMSINKCENSDGEISSKG